MTLAGKTIVVTRPREQSGEMIEALQALHADVLALPTLEIEPLQLDATARSRILDLDRYDWVICVSVNAVRLGLSALSDYWPQWPVQQQWVAVGPATGDELQQWQVNPRVAQQGSTSETLLDWPELQRLSNQRILILRGEGGRETLADTLRQRGAQVDYLELYRRVLPQVDPAPLQQCLQQGVTVILTVTSGDGLRNLMTLMGAQLESLRQCPLVVISGRLAQFAREQGFSRVIQAASPALQDVINTLEQSVDQEAE